MKAMRHSFWALRGDDGKRKRIAAGRQRGDAGRRRISQVSGMRAWQRLASSGNAWQLPNRQFYLLALRLMWRQVPTCHPENGQ
jgi:hypothetical protein